MRKLSWKAAFAYVRNSDGYTKQTWRESYDLLLNEGVEEMGRLKTRLKTMEDHAIAQSRVVDKANAEAVVQYNHWGDALRKIDQLNNELAAQRGLAKSLLGERDIAMENRLRQDEEIDQLKKQLTEAQDENMRIALRRSS